MRRPLQWLNRHPKLRFTLALGSVTVSGLFVSAVVWRRAYLKSLPPPPLRRTEAFVTGTAAPIAMRLSDIGWVAMVRIVLLCLHAWRLIAEIAWLSMGRALSLLTHEAYKRRVSMRFAACLVSLGPTYIKLGQWMASRPDVFPSELCESLVTLFDKAPPHRFEHTAEILRAAGVADHFQRVEEVPMNSGSVAQVHRAILRDSVDGIAAGTAVALKVVHPHVRELIAADIAALSTAVSLLEAVVPSAKFLDLRRALGEFAALLESQLDLRRECDNLLQFRYNFCEFDGIVFPAPLPTLSTADVLVETFEEGLPLSSFECNNTDFPFGRRSLVADVGCHMFLKMLFHDNFVHSDLHPGNVLVRPRNPATAQRQPWWQVPTPAEVELVILDPGLVTVLSPEERDNFISLFAAVACGDGQLGAELMLDRMRKPCTVDREAFVREMTNIFDQVGPSSTGFKLSKVDLGRVLGQILNTVRIHGATIDGNFSSLVVTVIVGEAMGRKLTPDFNIFAAAAPYMIKYLENTELRFLVAKLSNTFAPTELLHETVTVDRTTTYLSVAQAKGLDLLDACIRAMHLA